MERRDLLKNLGLLAGAAVLPNALRVTNLNTPFTEEIKQLFKPLQLDKPVTVITIGAGNRGNTYSNYQLLFPEQMKIIGVAEPIEKL